MPSTRLGRIRWMLRTQYGLDVGQALLGLRRTPGFVRDWSRFRRMGGATSECMPCLHDGSEASGDARGEYFWQDLYVAQKIRRHAPARHIDVGSRVDGFVAHLASFRELDVVDIRPLNSDIPGVHFVQHDMMSKVVPPSLLADSVSCLHALEHFGLGRYGEPLDPQGHERGFRNLAAMTLPGGVLYLSVPIGRGRVQFNANRIIDPLEVLAWADMHELHVEELSVVRGDAAPRVEHDVRAAVAREARSDCALGIFVLRKAGPSGHAVGSAPDVS